MIERRRLLQLSAAILATPSLGLYPNLLRAQDLPLIQRAIPASGE